MKRPPPGRMRGLLGATVAVALVAGGTYSAWAMQAGPTSSGHESRGMMDLQTRSLDRADKPAMYRRLARISYPQELMEAKVEGVVYVKAHVDDAGNVLDAAVDHIDPPESTSLGEHAVAGVRNWAFEPARKQGKPIASDEIIPVVFALDKQASPKISGATLGPVRVALPKPQTSVLPPPLLHETGPANDVARTAKAIPGNPATRAAVPPAMEAKRAAAVAMPAKPAADRAPDRGADPANQSRKVTASARAPDSRAVAEGVFVPPRVAQRWRPPYPAQAYKANAEGEAEVLVTIAADGSLTDARISRSSGSDALDQASLDAVKRYEFVAAQKGGVPIDAQANVAFAWSISPPLEFTSVSGMTVRRGAP